MSETELEPIEPEVSSSDLLVDLDSLQRAAVSSDAPLLAVIAGAGSGKTRVLTRRVAWQVLEGFAAAEHVAVLTFTRQAASELRRRLRTLGVRDGVTAGTFHSVALSLLRQHWDSTGRAHPTVVSDRRRLIGEVMGAKRSADIAALSADVDWARARNVPPERYAATLSATGRRGSAPATEVARIMSDLEVLKKKRGVIDLDDLLSHSIQLMTSSEQFASVVRWRLRHFFVDEAQDLNPLQLEMLRLWRGERDQLTLVGDPSQSIYGFNGGDPAILSELESNFPGIEVVRLDTNYRCTPQIVAAGLGALAHSATPTPDLRSARFDGEPVRIVGFADDAAEASGIATIVDDFATQDWRSIAVLARTNAQLAPILGALRARRVPARIIGSAAGDPVQRATREVGELPSAARIATWVRDARETVDDAVDGDFAPVSSDETVEEFAARIRVARAAEEFLLSGGGGDGRAFLAWVRANRPFDDDHERDVVELLTFHGAKGREWDTVVVAGCENGLVPHSSAKSPAERDEEVRLAYVAITRAGDNLVLTHASRRRGRDRTRSPFIDGADARRVGSAPTDEFRKASADRRSRPDVTTVVLEQLRAWRTAAARASLVDGRVLLSDEALLRIAAVAPDTLDELAAIEGVGAVTAGRSGARILDAVRRGIERATDFADD
ncbi:MAG: ATP-dependent helicase [Acidimicrobiia bacterium]